MAASIQLCEFYIYMAFQPARHNQTSCVRRNTGFSTLISRTASGFGSSVLAQSQKKKAAMRNNFLDMGFFNRSSSESSSSSNILSFHYTAKWNAHFNASKETDKLMVIDFNATWCGPCKFMDSVIQEYAAKYTDVEFIKIDVDELMEVSRVFQVQTLPTFLLIKRGKVVQRVTGARKEELEKLILNHRSAIV